MKSQIHENRKNKLQSLSKNLLMVLAVALGTTVMVNAQTTPAQAAPAKEVKSTKKEHKTHNAHKAEASKSSTTEAAAPKK